MSSGVRKDQHWLPLSGVVLLPVDVTFRATRCDHVLVSVVAWMCVLCMRPVFVCFGVFFLPIQ